MSLEQALAVVGGDREIRAQVIPALQEFELRLEQRFIDVRDRALDRVAGYLNELSWPTASA